MVYGEYVNHMIKSFYAQIAPDEVTPVSQQNRKICASVINELPCQDERILRLVYSDLGKGSMTDAVRNCAELVGVSPGEIWHVVKVVSKQIARKRGLID